MTDRVFQDESSFEVSGGDSRVEVYVYGGVTITVTEDAGFGKPPHPDAGWASQRAYFTMTAEEATMLKEFLISKGY